MNIIQLFEFSGIYTENLRGFTSEDAVKAKKQFEIEQSQDPSINTDLADNLILAMNEYPRELLFISNNRILYNFFSGKNYSRNRFSSDNAVSVSAESVQFFIKKFLEKDLDLFFDQCINSNRFENIDDLLLVKEYLPQSVLETLGVKVSNRLDFVIDKINLDPSLREQIYAIDFIKQKSFYDLVSHFRSEEIDEKIRSIYSKISSLLVDQKIRQSIVLSVQMAMGNYKAVDPKLVNLLNANKNQAYAETESKNETSSGGMSTWSYILIIIFVLRIIMAMARCGRM